MSTGIFNLDPICSSLKRTVISMTPPNQDRSLNLIVQGASVVSDLLYPKLDSNHQSECV